MGTLKRATLKKTVAMGTVMALTAFGVASCGGDSDSSGSAVAATSTSP